MNVRNAVLIGAQKAGTTSIYNWLAQHPEILAPDWAKDNYALFLNEDLSARLDEAYGKVLAARTTEKVVLTSNVNYLFHPDTAGRIKRFDPLMRLICILRNPVDRAFSAYQYARERDLEDRSFEDAVSDELSRGDGCYASPGEAAQKSYILHGMYHRQLLPYFERFPAGQIFVGLYEDLHSDTAGFVKELLAFLGVDTTVELDLTPRNVTQGGSRSRLLNKALYSTSLKRSALAGLWRSALSDKTRYRFKKALRSFNARKAGRRDRMMPATRARLDAVFAEEVLRLQGLTGRDLGGWRLAGPPQPR
jgi:hypothetical protein